MSKEQDKVVWGSVGIILVLIIVFIANFTGGSKKPLLQSEAWEGVKIEKITTFYDNNSQVNEAYRNLVDSEDELSRDGFAIWYKDEPYCEIHTLRIRHQEDEERMKLLGHELLHCIYGTWHKE